MRPTVCGWVAAVLLCWWTLAQSQDCPCLNGGECVGQDGGPPCECPAGYGDLLCNATEFCVSEVAAGIMWPDAPPGARHEVPCQQLDFLLLGGKVYRTCEEGFTWSNIGLTDCTVPSDVELLPTLFVWFQITLSPAQDIDLIAKGIGDVINGLLQDSERFVVDMLPMYRVTDMEWVLTYRIESELYPPNIEAQLRGINHDSLLELPEEDTVLISTTGLQGYSQSSTCSCAPTEQLFEGLCVSLALLTPCSCDGPPQQEDCQVVCTPPFYVGNGDRCTVDSEGDGFPDVPLDTCNTTSMNDSLNYCNQDVCPDVYDDTQNPSSCSADIDFSGCASNVDPFWGILWANTPTDSTDQERCPDSKGFATRYCSSTGWEEPDVSQCESSGYSSVREQLGGLDAGAPVMDRLEETSSLTDDILDLTEPQQGVSVLPEDLDAVNFVIDEVVGLLEETLTTDDNITEIPDQNVLSILSNVLDINNLEGWTTLQESGQAGGQLLLDSAERYGLYLAMAMGHGGRRTENSSNLVIGYSQNDPSTDSPTTFPASVEDLGGAFNGRIPAQVTIPAQYLQEFGQGSGSTVPVSTMIFRNMERVLPVERSTVQVASMLISSQVSQRPSRGQQGVQSDVLVENPVELVFTFDEVANASNFRCAFWEFSDPIGNGTWSVSGVVTTSSTTEDGQTVVTCQSTHLTSFAVLVDTSGSLDDDDTELKALAIVSYIGCAISIACLIITVIFFLLLGKNLFISVHHFIHLNLALSLLAAYIVFVFGIELGNSTKGGCVFVAALLQYLFLSAFCWMLCEGIMLYLMLVVVFSTLSKRWWLFLIIGWGPPILPVVIGLAARHDEYGVEDDNGNLLYCWLSTEKGVIWAFVGPMLLIIMVNTVFLVIALVKVFQSTRGRAQRKGGKTSTKENIGLFKVLFKATIVLLPILGLTWVFGLLTVNRDLTVFAWLFTIFNSLQGLFIFFFHVVRSEKIWQSTRAKHFRSKASSKFLTTRTSGKFSVIRKTSRSQAPIYRKNGSDIVTSLESGDTVLTGVASGDWNSLTEAGNGASNLSPTDDHNEQNADGEDPASDT